MTQNIQLEWWFPASPLVVAVMLAALVLYTIYRLAKFVVSIYTGAS